MTEAQLRKRKLQLEVEKLEQEAELFRAQAAEAVREQKLHDTGDWVNGVFHFVGDVADESVLDAVRDIGEFRRFAPRKPVTLHLNSSGGLNTAGLHLYSFLREVPKLTIHVRGWAASMATVVLQAATVRRMDAEAHLMVHKSNCGVPRLDADSFMVEAETLKVWSEQVLRILADRSHLTLEELDARTKHRDWYLTGPEALAHGLVDELIY